MNQKQLEYILAIYQYQNITKAAEHLYITRSALNYSLLNLEHEIGMPLFKRINNQLLPTAAGEVYLSYARKIILLANECDTAMKDMRDSTRGHLDIGITPGYGQQIFADIYPDFYQKYPLYNIRLCEGNAKILYQDLHDGKIDLAWCAFHRYEQNLEHKILEKMEVYLAVPEPRCKQKFDPRLLFQKIPADLTLYRQDHFVFMNPNSLVRDISEIYLNEAGVNPQCLMECSLISMTRDFTKKNIALSFLPSSLCLPGLGIVYYPLPKPEYFSLAISYRKGTFLTIAERFLIDLIQNRYKNIISK